MTDITEVFLPSMPPSKKATNEGEIHIVHDTGKSVMTLLVPHPEEVYKVCDFYFYFMFWTHEFELYSILWKERRVLIPISQIRITVFALQMCLVAS